MTKPKVQKQDKYDIYNNPQIHKIVKKLISDCYSTTRAEVSF